MQIPPVRLRLPPSPRNPIAPDNGNPSRAPAPHRRDAHKPGGLRQPHETDRQIHLLQ